MTPILSVLTAAVPSRIQMADSLAERIDHQIHAAGVPAGAVEHLILLDNKARSVGLKRQALLDIALGDYIIYLDDDDDMADDYIPCLLAAAARGSDVITFKQLALINGEEGHIEFHGNAEKDEPWQVGATVRRPPWHVCAWRRELVKRCVFPDINDGEDIVWCHQARPLLKTCTHIDRVLHTYRFSSATTEATGR